ncbi:MAG: DsbA family protein, partial [Anaerolineae bacterium]|nr:DsbA family protein [Anaerolineae bacterium]
MKLQVKIAAGVLIVVAFAAAGLILASATPRASDEPRITEQPLANFADPTVQPDQTGTSTVTARGFEVGFTDDGDPYQGDESAPVVVEEFSSYQCPFCAKYFQESYAQVIENYVETGQVRYIFRDYPLPTQAQSQLAAEAASCAGQTAESSAYWAMHDRLFASQAEWSGRTGAADIFTRYARELGIDETSFEECLASGATRVSIQADAAEGSSRGVRGTPTVFINGQALVGAQPYATIARAIDAALAGDEALASELPEPAEPALELTPASIIPPDDALRLGDPAAQITVVEFSDYQCPYCASHFRDILPLILTEYVDSGRVQYIFKDFPLTSIHPQAPKAHEAARCAGDQDAYWDMHDRIFDHQTEWASSPDPSSVFKRIAAELGLETARFESCLDTGKFAAAVRADAAEGTSLGVSGTPTFYINGYPLVGSQP